jgi:glycolate oxidase
MKTSIRDQLIAVVGEGNAATHPEDLVAYSYDAFTVEGRPDIVLFPRTTEHVSRLMAIASHYRIPVTARGSGTNLAGQTVPVRGGIVACLSRMDRILAIDPASLTAVAQAGVINYTLQEAVKAHGLMYPPDPSSWMVATLGGTVGTNAGGPKTVKYGVTRDYLLSLTVVLPDGRVLRTGKESTRRPPGYDLTGLICGSEGTLGIVTEITVRLIPAPRGSMTLRAEFDRLEDCSTAVAAIMEQGIVPAALELMDRCITGAVESVAHLGLPLDAEGLLLIEVDGDPGSLRSQTERIGEVLDKHRARGIVTAHDKAETEILWRARRAAFSAMASMRPSSVTEDITVPVTHLPAMVRKVTEIAQRHRLQIGVLAHAGDGNLHPLILFDQRDQEECSRVEQACAEIFESAVELGGTLSGEHGIGLAKKPFLALQMDAVSSRVTAALKHAFDPHGILNPGKFV